jgi:HK97 family phage prohead protease
VRQDRAATQDDQDHGAPTTELGEFSAIAAAYSIDRDGDQIVRGAFGRTIERWQASDKRIPLHWHHSASPKDIIGFVDPGSMRELPEGLFVRGKVDLDGSTVARDAWRPMKDHAVSLSFGYLTVDSFRRPDGIKELRELDLFEISITPAPANPDTHILETKSLGADEVEREAKRLFCTPEEQRVYVEAHDQVLALLDGSVDSEAAIEREEKRHARKLRRDSDRLRLELALGNPPPEREAP